MDDAVKKEKEAAEVEKMKKMADDVPKKDAKIKELEAKNKKLTDDAAKKDAEAKKEAANKPK